MDARELQKLNQVNNASEYSNYVCLWFFLPLLVLFLLWLLLVLVNIQGFRGLDTYSDSTEITFETSRIINPISFWHLCHRLLITPTFHLQGSNSIYFFTLYFYFMNGSKYYYILDTWDLQEVEETMKRKDHCLQIIYLSINLVQYLFTNLPNSSAFSDDIDVLVMLDLWRRMKLELTYRTICGILITRSWYIRRIEIAAYAYVTLVNGLRNNIW